ncbi:ribosome maturation factor RimM [Denitromonas ohlonensis]|jgi:16S rRNA processing protein RimM|uniref:Ribosome maturation factor RimM n=2 Tax=Denitromonas TaxID=139331 RepID=A0A557RNS2_9RHOO|nr:ribosome maturation factor RimM [Denitromonas ohlonensis]TVT48291.1 MAG: 16S rRNA processing protein RimM [Denitromonas halophila]TVO66776.1 16S rRNA processing protein RimM [Denitromonas ohlonensis]TVO79646.1 16S rRNA processing protein RimM [Denitromonas ohlonensis]TVT71494.1 MAG: 16S rRNA processing protein RimM [Denitromonas halophila]TVT76862.1 MAG: 16S rRNA processing protein RimM [Denitromonas halophila]
MIILGRIVAPFGVQGWVKIHPFGDDPLSWKKMPQWWLSPDDTAEAPAWKAYKLAGCRAHGKGWIAAFEGVADRNGAEALTRQYIAAPREAMPATDSNEYYWGDLIGLQVENEAGEALGTVSSLLSAGAHDVLQIADGEDEHLVPFVAAYVLDVDLAEKRIRVVWQKDW